MADDAAAPDGELTEPSRRADGADADKSGAAEPEAGGTEPESTATLEDANEDAAEPDVVDSVEDDEALDSGAERPATARMSHVRVATIIGLVAVLALAGLTGWLGYGAYHAYKADEQRKLFLQVGRQGAINLTTIDWQHAEADVQRILDSATGSFYDEFQGRAEPFVAVVKQAQSKSVGTVTEAGVEAGIRRSRHRTRRGDRSDVESWCARTTATRMEDEDHCAERRRRQRQSVRREVRAVSRHRMPPGGGAESPQDTARCRGCHRCGRSADHADAR